ncbi:hypothetical protein D3C75_1020820 [compost metagenome]
MPLAEVATSTTVASIIVTMPDRESIISLMLRLIWPISSSDATTTRSLNRPSVTRFITWEIAVIGFTTRRIRYSDKNTTIKMTAATKIAAIVWAEVTLA